MTTAVGGTSEKPVLQILDAGLSLVASKAAIEIDCLLLGRKFGFEAVNQLARLLENSVEVTEGAGKAQSLMDAPTVSAVDKAMSDSEWAAGELTTIDQLVAEAAKIAGVASGVVSGSETKKESLEKLRAFCVALARCASAYRQSIFDEQKPVHRYRK